jgi:hypothetical protein
MHTNHMHTLQVWSLCFPPPQNSKLCAETKTGDSWTSDNRMWSPAARHALLPPQPSPVTPTTYYIHSTQHAFPAIVGIYLSPASCRPCGCVCARQARRFSVGRDGTSWEGCRLSTLAPAKGVAAITPIFSPARLTYPAAAAPWPKTYRLHAW